MAWTCQSGSIPFLWQGQRLCARKFSVPCPCVLHALCQEVGSLMGPSVGVACGLKGALVFFCRLCALVAWTCQSGSIPFLCTLQGQRLCARKFSVPCPCVLHALCQEVGSLMGPSVGVVGPVRPAALEYLGGRHLIMFGAANDFWRSGNLGRQPETRKGIKLGGCLREQGVGRINQHTKSWFVGHERRAVARHAAPPHPWVCRGAIST